MCKKSKNSLDGYGNTCESDGVMKKHTQNIILTAGEKLPVGAKFSRWTLTNGQAQPSNFENIVESYHPDNYFRGGKYLGADEAGVEPVWTLASPTR